MSDITNIVDYYVNLLIIQYHDKPKAQETIRLLVNELLANGILIDVRDGYDIETATGTQLDILGKYIGVDRMCKDNVLSDMFSLVEYDEAIPDAEDRWGFVTYSNYDTVNENGVLNYYSILTNNFFLIDDVYRQLLKLKIIRNNINHSHKSIDDALYSFFGNTLTADSSGNMEMSFFVSTELSQVVIAALQKDIMPRPMGVKLTNFITSSKPIFGFTNYSGTVGIHATGLTDYTDYSLASGVILNYDKITEA